MNMILAAVLIFAAPWQPTDITQVREDTDLPDHRSIRIAVVGGQAKEPIRNARLLITADRSKESAHIGTTDMAGEVTARIAPGVYYLEIAPPRPIPYLSIPPNYNGSPDAHSRWIRVSEEDSELQSYTIELADACQLTLKAIDIESGEPIPGVVFATECAAGEQWAQPIRGDNLGNRNQPSSLEHASLRTDKNGVFQCLIGPRPGWVYFVWDVPEGYERADETVDVSIDSSNGRESASHTFKFRLKR